MKAKFHKSCRDKLNDMKLERAERKAKKSNNEDNGPELVFNVIEDEQMMSPRTSSRLSSSKDTNTLEPKLKDKFCFFCKKTEPRTLRLALSFNLDRKVREYAQMFYRILVSLQNLVLTVT